MRKKESIKSLLSIKLHTKFSSAEDPIQLVSPAWKKKFISSGYLRSLSAYSINGLPERKKKRS
jgi:hypothetical protein